MLHRIKMFFTAMLAVGTDKELDRVIAELRALEENLKPLARERDRCKGLVQLFNLTSPWHDRGLRDLINKLERTNWRDQYSSTIESLKGLEDLFTHTGRNKHGWNRTNPGETVTEDNVYLGNVFGIWTFPIASFRRRQDDPPYDLAGWDCLYLRGKNTFQIVSEYQARPFVHKNVRAIVDLIDSL